MLPFPASSPTYADCGVWSSSTMAKWRCLSKNDTELFKLKVLRPPVQRTLRNVYYKTVNQCLVLMTRKGVAPFLRFCHMQCKLVHQTLKLYPHFSFKSFVYCWDLLIPLMPNPINALHYVQCDFNHTFCNWATQSTQNQITLPPYPGYRLSLQGLRILHGRFGKKGQC